MGVSAVAASTQLRSCGVVSIGVAGVGEGDAAAGEEEPPPPPQAASVAMKATATQRHRVVSDMFGFFREDAGSTHFDLESAKPGRAGAADDLVAQFDIGDVVAGVDEPAVDRVLQERARIVAHGR
jgi:hypothetical protein